LVPERTDNGRLMCRAIMTDVAPTRGHAMIDDKTERAKPERKLERPLGALDTTIDHTAQELQRLTKDIADLDAPFSGPQKLDRRRKSRRCVEMPIMSAITMADLSASDAEELIVQVWLLLEQQQVVSPEVVVKSLSDDLQIQLLFTLRGDADLVRSKLKDWAGNRGLRMH
jgi:hypothetical protein